MSKMTSLPIVKKQLYSSDQRKRRDESIWTTVQGILAPVQFIVFLVSVYFIVVFLLTGDGYREAASSVVIKTIVLLTIMVTGAIWEKAVFGRYLLAPAFFWEDVVSFFVIAFHIAYVFVLAANVFSSKTQIVIAVIAYILYLINAIQFLVKFRSARITANLVPESEKEAVA